MSAIENKAEAIRRILAASPRLRALGVVEIGIFGSFVTGQQTSASDVDVLVRFAADQHSFDSFMELSFFLEELLGRRVDLVTTDALSPHIGPHILREVERVPIAA